MKTPLNIFNKRIKLLFFFILFPVITWSQTLKLVSPSGGEQWKPGSHQKITWNSESVANIKIEFSLDNGYTWKTLISSFDASAGEYHWKISSDRIPKVLIRISDSSKPEINDINYANFTLPNEGNKHTNSLVIPVKIMPLGDSITEGEGDPNYSGYRRPLDSLLTLFGYSFDFIGSRSFGDPPDFDQDHEGHGGFHAHIVHPSERSLLDSLGEYLTGNPPDIILLHIGTNDIGGQNPLGVADEVIRILDTIYNFDSSIVTVLAKIVDRANSLTVHNRVISFNDTELPQRIDSLPAFRREKIILVDMYTALGQRYNNPSNPNFFSDIIHPSEAGYKLMSVTWFDSLARILSPGPEIFDLRFQVVENQGIHLGNFDVMVQIRSSAVFKMATSKISFNFNNSGMNFVELLTAHNFDSSVNAAYNPMTAIEVMPGVISLNVSFDTTNSGLATDVSLTPDWTDVATLRFSIQDTNQSSALVFRSSSPENTYVYKCEGADETFTTALLNIGTLDSLDEILPVELDLFTAKVNDDQVELQWRTVTEINNHGFEIERKSGSLLNGLNDWKKIGFIKGSGNSNSEKKYFFTDNNPLGGSRFIYRLKQVDNNGTFTYSDEIEVDLIPIKFELHQNFPNPFNPVTNIKFSLPVKDRVRMDVYNVIGEHIINLIDAELEQGFHVIQFNADNLSSGFYFYSISSENFSQTKKMLLVK